MIAGIFVGGASRRMGGAPKGLLPVDGEPLVLRTVRACRAAGLEPVLVGEHASYAALGVPMIPDAEAGRGPLGGLAALLAHAERAGAHEAIALACDMPYVTPELLRVLASAPPAPAVAPHLDERWQPFFARYEVARAAPVVREALRDGRAALQRVLDALGATPLPLDATAARALRDWDEPGDVDA